MRFILSGFLLVATGTVLPFLMTARVIEPSLALSFLAYAASLGGLALGLGVAVSCASGRALRGVTPMRRDPGGL